MEIFCTRCHQPVQAGNTYCPSCGLPQLVYSAEVADGQPQAERWQGSVQDASAVSWKAAIRAAVLLGVPAGLLSSGASPLGIFGLFWMSAAAAWAVLLYVRGQGPAWITAGAGARIGLVTGMIAAWLAFSASGSALFVQRHVLHQSAQIDSEWKARVDTSQQVTQQLMNSMGLADPVQLQAQRTWMMTPWGHAGIEVFGFTFNSIFLLCFAVGGGALGARLMTRARRPQ